MREDGQYLVSFGLADRSMALMAFDRERLWAGLVAAEKLSARAVGAPSTAALDGQLATPWLRLRPLKPATVGAHRP